MLQLVYDISLWKIFKGESCVIGHFCFSTDISTISLNCYDELRWTDFGFPSLQKERWIDLHWSVSEWRGGCTKRRDWSNEARPLHPVAELTLTCSFYSLAMDRATTEPLGLSRHSPPVAILSTRRIDHNRTTIHCPPTSSPFRPLFIGSSGGARAR